jgi:hypothetical protein
VILHALGEVPADAARDDRLDPRMTREIVARLVSFALALSSASN